MRELGLPQVDTAVWHGIYAPKGTPAAVVRQVNEALQVALADPAIQKRLADMGTELFPAAERSPAAHAQYLAKDLARARDVVKAGNIQLD